MHLRSQLRRRRRAGEVVKPLSVKGPPDRDAYASDPAYYHERFYQADGLTPRASVGADMPAYMVRWYYAQVEAAICSTVGRYIEGAHVLDVGCGSGHWLGFYAALGAARVYGLDFAPSVVALPYPIHVADITEVTLTPAYDIVNVVGVMHHITDDDKWARAIATCIAAAKYESWIVFTAYMPDASADRSAWCRVRDRCAWAFEIESWGGDIVDSVKLSPVADFPCSVWVVRKVRL